MSDLVNIHFYDETTGLFSGRSLAVSASLVERMTEANRPAGHKAFIGDADPTSQRIDIDTGELVDHRPPSPGDDYVWTEQPRRRWVKKEAIQRWEYEKAQAQDRIDALERKSLRSQRELSIDSQNKDAKQRISDIEAEIAALRAIVNSPKPVSVETGATS